MREIRSAPSNCPENLVHLCTGEDKPQGDRKMGINRETDENKAINPTTPSEATEATQAMSAEANTESSVMAKVGVSQTKIEGSVSGLDGKFEKALASNPTDLEKHMQKLNQKLAAAEAAMNA